MEDFDKYDLNSDGVLGADEWVLLASEFTLHASDLQTMDTNNDRVVDKDEYVVRIYAGTFCPAYFKINLVVTFGAYPNPARTLTHENFKLEFFSDSSCMMPGRNISWSNTTAVSNETMTDGVLSYRVTLKLSSRLENSYFEV